jgi:hypothetical protein
MLARHLLVVIGACGGTTTAVDAGTDAPPVVCWGDVRTAQDRMCTGQSDCAVVAHQSDCCGTIIEEGVRDDQVDAVHDAETAANASCGLCKCVPLPTTDEEGQMGGAYVASCDTGLCTAHAQ